MKQAAGVKQVTAEFLVISASNKSQATVPVGFVSVIQAEPVATSVVAASKIGKGAS